MWPTIRCARNAATGIAGGLSSALVARKVDLVLGLSLAFLRVACRPVAVGHIQTSGRFAQARLSSARRSSKIPVTGQIDAAKIAIATLTQRSPTFPAAISAIRHAAPVEPGAKDDQARQQPLHPNCAITQRGATRTARVRSKRATKTLQGRHMPLIERYQRQCDGSHGHQGR